MNGNQVMAFFLGTVIMGSLGLLVFGLDPEGWQIKYLQLPVVIGQIFFICAVLRYIGYRKLVAMFSVPQRFLFVALFVYVPAVSFTSHVSSADNFAHFWMIHILFFIAAFGFFRQQNASEIDWIWTILGVTGLIHVVAFAFAWIVWPDDVREMLLPAFINIRNLGYLLSPAAAVMAVLFITRQGHPALTFTCYFAAVFYLIYTGSRGGFGAAVAGLLIMGVYLWWHQQSVSPKRISALVALTIGSIVLSEFLPHLPWEPIFSRSVETANQIGIQKLNGRENVWSGAWQAITENWVFGYGPALMRKIPEYVGPYYRHPHNIVLQLLLHWGVIGTAIITALVLTFTRPIWNFIARHPATARAPLSVLLSMLIYALVEAGLYYPFSTVIAIVSFAVLAGLRPEKTNSAVMQ